MPLPTEPTEPTTPMHSRDILTLRIELLHVSPLVWRQLEIPVSTTLATLHDIVQAAMGWSDSHLWEFEIDGRSYALQNEDEAPGERPAIDARSTTLTQILKVRETTIDYRYDFGDDWELRLTLAARRPRTAGTTYPRYIGGERNAPPEDCGGVSGFDELLSALADPTHPELSELLEWVGDYDPDVIDEASIRLALADLST